MAKQAKSRLGLTIDHVLIAVRDLKDTADVFNNLGFTVTPEGLHPCLLYTSPSPRDS